MSIIISRDIRINFGAFGLTLSSITSSIYANNKTVRPKIKPTTQTGILNTPE